MLVTVARYQAITGDTTTAASAVSARIEEATEALEDILDRPLEHAERTESLFPTRDGYLWPKATPITAGGSYEIDGDGLKATTPWPAGTFFGEPGYVSVTYSGGFVERTANPTAVNRLPTYMERDIAFAAKALVDNRQPTGVPVGATSVRAGDVAVSYGPRGAPASVDPLSGVWSRRTLSWRYAPVGTRP